MHQKRTLIHLILPQMNADFPTESTQTDQNHKNQRTPKKISADQSKP